MPTTKQIIGLLEEQNRGALQTLCLDTLVAGSEVTSSTKPVPLQQAKNIFRSRARINEKFNHSSIKGFEELLVGLDKFTHDYVVSSSVTTQYGYYRIFSDVNATELAGVLLIPFAKVDVEVCE